MDCCHSRSESLGVTWEHGSLPDIMKIQVQHDHTLKTWEGRDGNSVECMNQTSRGGGVLRESVIKLSRVFRYVKGEDLESYAKESESHFLEE